MHSRHIKFAIRLKKEKNKERNTTKRLGGPGVGGVLPPDHRLAPSIASSYFLHVQPHSTRRVVEWSHETVNKWDCGGLITKASDEELANLQINKSSDTVLLALGPKA